MNVQLLLREFYDTSHTEDSFRVIQGFCHDFAQAKVQEKHEIDLKSKELKQKLETVKVSLRDSQTELKNVEEFTTKQFRYIEKLKEKEREGFKATKQLEKETFSEHHKFESEL